MMILVGVPKEIWVEEADNDFWRMVEETRRYQKLIEKKANQTLNIRRLVMSRQAVWDFTSKNLEFCQDSNSFETILVNQHFPAIRIDEVQCIENIPFEIAPDEATLWINKIRPLVPNEHQWYLEKLSSMECGIIFIPYAYSGVKKHETSPSEFQLSGSRIESQNIRIAPGEDIETQQVAEEVIENEFLLLQQEIARSIKDRAAVNVSNYHHQVLTAGFHRIIFKENVMTNLEIIYDDNSHSLDFPVHPRSLSDQQIQELEACQPLRCALMSMRHVEMDGIVDIAWFNNRETSLKGVSSADIDRLCYERSLQLFASLPQNELTCIWMYQTGFQPSIIGFYRALAEVLYKGLPKVAVKPMIFQGSSQYRHYDWWA